MADNWIVRSLIWFCLIVLASLAFINSVFAQSQLKWGFEPVQVLGVRKTNASPMTFDVDVSYVSEDVNGSSIYSSSVSNFASPAVADLLRNKAKESNGGYCAYATSQGLACVNDDFQRSGSEPNPEFETAGVTCVGDPNFIVSACVSRESDVITGVNSNWEYMLLRCHGNMWQNALEIRFRQNPLHTEDWQFGTWGLITDLPAGFCTGRGGEEIPPGEDPEIPDLELVETFAAGNGINPQLFTEPSTGRPIAGLTSTPTYNQNSTTITNNYNNVTNNTTLGVVPGGFTRTSPAPAGSGGGGTSGPPLALGGGGSGQPLTFGNNPSDVGQSPNSCQTHPNSIGCQPKEITGINAIKAMLPNLTFITENVGTALVPVEIANGSGCPPPLEINFLGSVMSLPYTAACTAGDILRPLVTLLAALFSMYIIVGYKSAGT